MTKMSKKNILGLFAFAAMLEAANPLPNFGNIQDATLRVKRKKTDDFKGKTIGEYKPTLKEFFFENGEIRVFALNEKNARRKYNNYLNS